MKVRTFENLNIWMTLDISSSHSKYIEHLKSFGQFSRQENLGNLELLPGDTVQGGRPLRYSEFLLE